MTERSHLIFRKSSYSSGTGQNCVEVADFPGGAAVRDTQNRELGHITFSAAEWTTLLETIRNG
ncbi:DUF397 domain-containing protein [Nocardiopsis sp. N85]|uniref:DUF397 domain-containing protein n=1 Tax=Nocardiopsis sp. N85 TaxID=3029400 RepID=UPI00237F48D2|nr:DUF397 domain-containing protein [Nocardiopsis sp. N85]MDE3723041.1 DUF397 domain-containing protein [Nocardiopsis sp. N85]